MNSEAVISVKNVSKKFSMSLRRSMLLGMKDVFRSMIGLKCQTEVLRKGEFWALRNVSFELKKGEMLGIVGQNGSGKSTLLRILTGIYPPDDGHVTIKGRVGALISVGAGFHPHLSGRENIYLNGTILGMDSKTLSENLDKIIEFAEIGDFIDSPVSTYSSGMTVRLGFSIAVHSFPEILIADEILSVGDLQFTLKCYRKLAEYKKNGGTLILVSHSIQQVRNFCSKVLWLDKSEIKDYGETQKVCDAFETSMLRKDIAAEEGQSNEELTILNYDTQTRIIKVEFLDSILSKKTEFQSGESFKIRMHYDFKRTVVQPIFTISILTVENIQLVSNYSNFDGFKPESLAGTGFIDIAFIGMCLKPSRYKCMITLAEENNVNKVLEWHDKTYSFNIISNGDIFYGLIDPSPKWS